MKFQELYSNNRRAVEKALSAIWTENHNNSGSASLNTQHPGWEVQSAYGEDITNLIKNELFAPQQNADLIVQSLEPYQSVYSVPSENAEALVPDESGTSLWNKVAKGKYPPYEHQYRAWNELLTNRRSMVVTTGTGSGKTECFMLPLVSDLIRQKRQAITPHSVKAIFVYPLNALMEDQKKRLHTLLKDTGLTFAVYNGNLAECYYNNPGLEQTKINDAIDAERKEYQNTDGSYTILATREEVRSTPPDILLTNPTMMEYMLLRHADQVLFPHPDASGCIPVGDLSWIVIDEAHTYSGAGAAELSLLLRRVMLAFNVDALNVRFATSSATIGNASKSKIQQNQELQEFISGLSGQPASSIAVIDGKRIATGFHDANPEKFYARQILENNEFVYLSELFQDVSKYPTIDSRLEKLDQWCDSSYAEQPFRAKLHLFYRVPNGGLFVQLDSHSNGKFNISSNKPINASKTPFLELGRCEHCGNYLTVARFDTTHKTYSPIQDEHTDIFESMVAATSSGELSVVGISNSIDPTIGDNKAIEVNGTSWNEVNQTVSGQWYLVRNSKGMCPHCAAKLTTKDIDEQADDVNLSNVKLRYFRTPADFIARQLAPSTLEQTLSVVGSHPHSGQQYISFVDSRQSAARATLLQNREEERLWVWSTIYKELNRRANDTTELQKILKWEDVYSLLMNDSKADLLFEQFANRYNFQDFDASQYKPLYIEAVMVGYLAKRPRTQTSAETMGLFTSYYPFIENAQCPKVVQQVFTKYGSSISDSEWQDLLYIYIERSVRGHNALFLKQQGVNYGFNELTPFIFKATGTGSADKPEITIKPNSWSSIAKIVAQHFADTQSSDADTFLKAHHQDVNTIVGALFDTLYPHFIETAFNHIDGAWQPDMKDRKDASKGYRLKMNLTQLAFKLYSNPCLTDVDFNGGLHSCTLRPVEVLFKGYSPYLMGGKAIKPCTNREIWTPFTGGTSASLDSWAQANRGLLWNYDLWGNHGYFADYLEKVHLFNPDNLYIQAEHTAQVDKTQAKEVQTLFKNHDINILACSTTMEMGVDLGDLEIVMLTSVPPLPANYKQRAGRSGRNGYTRSACITLCGSDIIGLRTLYNPKDSLITRIVDTPRVDLQSPQVVQRHVNALLLRLSGTLFKGQNATTQEVIHFFTDWSWRHLQHNVYDKTCPEDSNGIRMGLNNAPILPSSANVTNMEYENFLLNRAKFDTYVLSALQKLLVDTLYVGKEVDVIDNSKIALDELRNGLIDRILALKNSYDLPSSTPNYKVLLNWKFYELLSKRLLEYLSTNRYTPNAHMPVDVVEFDLLPTRKPYHSKNLINNPSYPLHEALSQYAPGNCVVAGQRTHIVRGIEFTGMYLNANTFKQVYTDGNEVVIDNKAALHRTPIKWSEFSNKDNLELIEPYGFSPDATEIPSRVISPNTYTIVEAMLLGAKQWTSTMPLNHMYRVRPNDADGKILYYNMGIGHGYCVCPSCGRTAMELTASQHVHPLPSEMLGTDGYHTHLTKGKVCLGQKQQGKFRRNVILGSQIQTDFTEIQIKLNNQWVDQRGTCTSLLITLGILFAQALRDKLGVERNALDFTILPNGHICIYDTNPGGAGYANQLADPAIMQDVITKVYQILKNVHNTTDILDRFTLRYQNSIDILAAKTWVEDEIAQAAKVPVAVSSVFPSAVVASNAEIVQELCKHVSESSLFFDDDYSRWIVNNDMLSWVNCYRALCSSCMGCNSGLNTYVVSRLNPSVNYPVYEMIQELSHLTNSTMQICLNPLPPQFYPLAYCNGHLYFTTQLGESGANACWGMERDTSGRPIMQAETTVFRIECEMPNLTVRPILKPAINNVQKFKIEKDITHNQSTKSLEKLVYGKASAIFDSFKNHCEANSNQTLTLVCQDEHIKSMLSMIASIHMIEALIYETGCSHCNVQFVMEQYSGGKPSDYFAHNEVDDHHRDALLNGLLFGLEDVLRDKNITMSYTVSSKPEKTLPHWRSIELQYAGKTLTLYPNGGVLNGWGFDKRRADSQGLDVSKSFLTIEDDIPLWLKEDIMYDVTLE